MRDYLYVEDGARAYLPLAEQLAAQPGARAAKSFNFSYEQRTDGAGAGGQAPRRDGLRPEPDVRNEATNEIRDQYLDATKARSDARLVSGIHARDGPARDGGLVHGAPVSVAEPRAFPVVILCGGPARAWPSRPRSRRSRWSRSAAGRSSGTS